MLESSADFVAGSLPAMAAAWSYGIAAAAYLAFVLRIAADWRRGLRSALLLGALGVTVLWGAIGAWTVLAPQSSIWIAAEVVDVIRGCAWIAFLSALIAGGGNDTRALRGAWPSIAPTLAMSVALAAAFLMSLSLWGPVFGLRLGLAMLGLTLVETLFSRVEREARWAVKPMCVALFGVFGFDLVLYADAAMVAHLDGDLWSARGIANALVIPFIAIATARNPSWAVRLRVSREAVVYTTALLAAGAFLFLVACAGYLVRHAGGEWGRVLQIELLFAALVGLAMAGFSGRVRAKLRVFVSKHFFSYRYDYRKEWLRFTRMLASESERHGVQERVLMALADLVESPAAMLWLKEGESGFQPGACRNMPLVDAVELPHAPLVQFMERTGWVVDLDEYRADPASHPGLRLPPWLSEIPSAWLIVPLCAGSQMLGFAVLGIPRTPIEVNWEVRDLLKTAGRQAASYLGHVRATEALLEARKFESFNRMSAFVVHDLKNLVAQLSLLLRNAERHGHNEDFQRDMLSTVEHVVERMNHLMLELRTGTTPLQSPRPLALEPIVRRACGTRRHGPSIQLKIAPGVIAMGHEDRLESVIGHLVQNALDATAQGGQVHVQLDSDQEHARIVIADTGIGMSPEFIRKRLFKPFETTKTAGMGIGVYESSQYVAGLGGRMAIDSRLHVGTRVSVLLPLRERGNAAPIPHQEVA